MKNLFTSKDLKLVDLSQKIVPPGTPTRPFRVEQLLTRSNLETRNIYSFSCWNSH